jgi:cytochrome P450
MTGAVDLADLELWARGVPYTEFARLRRETPVVWAAEPAPNSGFWSVLGYADIVAAGRDVATFSSGRGVSFEEPTDEDMAARRTIIDTDPPGHTKLRKIVSGGFSQRAIALYREFVEGLTEEVLDAGLADGPFDFVDAVAKQVPIRVLAQIMGLPSSDLDRLIDLGDRLIANTDPDVTDVVWGRDDTDAYRRFPFRSPYGKQLWDLGRSIVAERLRAPGEDPLSRLLAAVKGDGEAGGGDRLTERDLDNFFSIMVVAGNETTRIAMAQGVLAFCEHPDQWDRLRADPGLLDTAADEVLRWTCPTHFMRRTAARDTALGGATIRAGDKVVLWYVSGNRDETEFPDPDVFDVGRSPNRHLSFGRGGPHLCLGAHLARLEVRAMLAALARRVAGFELAGPPRRIRSNFTNGLKELPIRARPV